MDVNVLGCSGGIGGLARTTALRVDADILIDCGTGVGELTLDDLMHIDHVFLTHSHLDHICLLPLLIDTVCDLRGRALTVYALEDTLQVLREHVFNWQVWPDFSAIPDRATPLLLMQPVRVGETIRLGERSIRVLPAYHTVPAAGYCVSGSQGGQLAFTGDTGMCDALVDALNGLADLRYLLIETAVPNEYQSLAHAARHLCPNLLHALLERLSVTPEVYVTHLKPGYADQTLRETLASTGRLQPRVLANGMRFCL